MTRGSGWSALDGGVSGLITFLDASAILSGGDLVVGGTFTIAGGNVSAFWASWRDAGSPSCIADLNGDGAIDGADLGMLLDQWGESGTGDLNADGIVNGADLGILLGNWTWS